MIFVWLAATYLVALSLYFLTDWFVKQVRGWQIQREFDEMETERLCRRAREVSQTLGTMQLTLSATLPKDIALTGGEASGDEYASVDNDPLQPRGYALDFSRRIH